HDALSSVLAGVEAAVRSEHEAVGFAGVLTKDRYLAIGGDLVNAVVRNVAEEDIAHGIDGRPFGEFVALADQFPAAVGIEHDVVADEMAGARDGFRDGPRVVAPKPAQRF